MNLFGKTLVRLGATPPPDDDFWYNAVQAPYSSYISQFDGGESALRVNAVSACVSLRSETIGSLPCQVFRRTETGREVDKSHPLYRILHDSPNDDLSAFEFWQRCEQDLCTDGNFYARIEMDQKTNVTGLYPLDPSKMDVKRDSQTGLLVYLYRDGGTTTPYFRDHILHIPGRGYDGQTRLKGMSPIEFMRQSIDLANDAETYGSRFFKNNGIPPAYVTSPNAMSDVAKVKFLDYLLNRFGGVRNAGKIPILDDGMEIKAIPIKHSDMQYLELRKFQIEEIARIFRVPLHKIGNLDRSTNNNIEHQGIEWVTDTIRPECVRIERRLNMQLLGPREAQGWFIEFNLDSLMRGDSAARSAFYSTLRNIGVLNANEIRRLENFNDYDGGDTYMVQGAMIPVNMAGQHQQQGVTQ